MNEGSPPTGADRGTYVAIAGNIGAGKSSFLTFLRHRFGLETVYEPNEGNPFLEPFYGDMPRWAFHSQVYFLAEKARLHRQIEAWNGHIGQDRTIWEDAEIFAAHLARTGVMSEDEHATYRALYDALSASLRPPDLLVYLRCPVRTLRRRIAARGRDMERGLPAKYLRSLHGLYERWFDSYDLGEKVVFDTDRFDPVTDLVDLRAAVDTLAPHFPTLAPARP